ncbi:hypothetical protein C1J05_11155 [Sulfitobacter sp. JL08]|nr:hypothetical protein C1J05_11155 [Sulfitobacter sp. JL08]
MPEDQIVNDPIEVFENYPLQVTSIPVFRKKLAFRWAGAREFDGHRTKRVLTLHQLRSTWNKIWPIINGSRVCKAVINTECSERLVPVKAVV